MICNPCRSGNHPADPTKKCCDCQHRPTKDSGGKPQPNA